MSKQLGFLFNADHCIGCTACEIACRNENHTNRNVRWRKVSKSSEGFLSLSCNHCNSPECSRVCPENAFMKRHDGIVLIDSNLCTGCRLCITACPYEAPQFDYETNKVSKCQMCYPRQDQGLLPACVDACSTEALQLVDLENFYDPQAVSSIFGIPDIRITQPSVVFYPISEKKRHFLVERSSN
ncbi:MULTISPECIES: 4Fe-4S dicluster domain-containing protein [Robertmurraya]|uniref:4Fe-4S dicluster domain-containing protein n=1 Tax=Robertmurraya TaxID=2837507 RepID=UPI001BB43CAB|nr:4Fe-4S dicluster domain-containing protein [Robertmurraya siralis]